MFDSIKSIIGDIASGAIKDQRIALSESQLAALDSKLKVLAEELALSKSREAKLTTENTQLRQQLERAEPVGLQENMGVLWKPTATGFEPHPYCRECQSHPIMIHPDGMDIWVCGNGKHHAPISVRPPTV